MMSRDQQQNLENPVIEPLHSSSKSDSVEEPSQPLVVIPSDGFSGETGNINGSKAEVGQEAKSGKFDASQYAFFGGNVETEVELGGLDDDGDDGGLDALEDETGPEDEPGLQEAIAGLTKTKKPEDISSLGEAAAVGVEELGRGFAELGSVSWQHDDAASEQAGQARGAYDAPPAAPNLLGSPWSMPPTSMTVASQSSLPSGSLDSIRRWWPEQSSSNEPPATAHQQQQQQQQHFTVDDKHDEGLRQSFHPSTPASMLQPPQQPVEHLPPEHGPRAGSFPLSFWQQQQQQQQHQRPLAGGQVGGGVLPHIRYPVSLEETGAGLVMHSGAGDPSSSPSASAALSYGLEAPASVYALPQQQLPPSAGYGASAVYQLQHVARQHTPIWGSSTGGPPAMLQAAQAQGQARAPYLPPQLLQSYHQTRAGGAMSPTLQPPSPSQPHPGYYGAGSQQQDVPPSQHMALDELEARYELQQRAARRQQQQQQQLQQRAGGGFGQGTGSFQQRQPQQIRSKYMSSEELEQIMRMQWAATHTSEPYADDYYYQAVQNKHFSTAAGGTGRRHFAPSQLRELPSHARNAPERHSYLPVEGLGRVPLASLRRPRPLLDMEPLGGGAGTGRGAAAGPVPQLQRPLEQEPMLAARIAIEDGMCLLLDVDDIDRVLLLSHSHAQPPEGVSQLRRRRQLLLENLAQALQLSDPMAPGSSMAHYHDPGSLGRGRPGPAGGPRDDLVFLRLVSLPKGRKLLARYLRLLAPGSELQRVVACAVFRHLRFLFGGIQSDTGASGGLASAVATAASGLSLPGLTACLSAVAVAPEQPPLRSLGSSAGDGATLILRALLDRATALRSDPTVSPQQHGSWQAAFDLFFDRLSRTLCFDNILSSLPLPASAAAAVSKEMPLELLRAALPHTSQAQREQVGALLQGLLRAT